MKVSRFFLFLIIFTVSDFYQPLHAMQKQDSSNGWSFFLCGVGVGTIVTALIGYKYWKESEKKAKKNGEDLQTAREDLRVMTSKSKELAGDLQKGNEALQKIVSELQFRITGSSQVRKPLSVGMNHAAHVLSDRLPDQQPMYLGSTPAKWNECSSWVYCNACVDAEKVDKAIYKPNERLSGNQIYMPPRRLQSVQCGICNSTESIFFKGDASCRLPHIPAHWFVPEA